MNRNVIVGVTGASGAAYALKLIQVLAESGVHVHLVVSPHGRRLFADELHISPLTVKSILGHESDEITVHAHNDVGSLIASGSYKTNGMVICPCSASSLGAIASLNPGEFVVVVENLAAFESRYGVGLNVAGQYRGRLSNGGEMLRLTGSLGETIQEFTFLDFWYPETDGDGFSLVIADEFADLGVWNEKEGWAASDVSLGSPGEEQNLAGGRQLPGDANQDGHLDVGDAVSMLLSLFRATGRALPCDGATIADGGNVTLLDYNADATVDTSDVIYLLTYLYRGGATHALGESCLRIEGCADGCFR